MKQSYIKSDSGNLKEVLRNVSDPDALIMISNSDQFNEHVDLLKKTFPNVPSIAGVGYFYGKTIREGGVGLMVLQGVEAVAGLMTHAKDMPVHDIDTLLKNMSKIGANAANTVCIDICTGNDAVVLTTMSSALNKAGVSLIGGTSMDAKVSANGEINDDADAYILIKNKGGRVKVYKENIYRPLDDETFVASETNKAEYYVGKLNGRPALDVYKEHLGVGDDAMATQTFTNPLGKITGDDIRIISIREVVGNGMSFYRQVNDSDILCFLDIKDYKAIVKQTVSDIKSDFSHVSGVISVNCAFRHILFTQNNFMDQYLDIMSDLGSHCGFVGNGEHFNDQFINQSMSCVVFE